MQAAEAVHLLRYCELMITGVLARKGMRGFYTIADYPPKMDKEIRSDYVVIWQDSGQTKMAYEPME